MSRNAIATLWWVTVALCVVASKPMLAQQPGPLPGWFDADIGPVDQPGSSSQSDDTFRVAGAGSDIWGPSDSFHFTYTNLPGDGDLYALARSQTADNPFAKAGVMIRQSIDLCSAKTTCAGIRAVMRPRGPGDIHGAARSAPASRSPDCPGEDDGRWAPAGSVSVTDRESLGPSWHAGAPGCSA